MALFDVSKEWVILLPPDAAQAKKAAADLSRCIGLLAGLGGNRSPKAPAVLDASNSSPSEAVIVLNSEGNGPEQNGFLWRAAPDRVEIFGESGRGLCSGIYSFLAALGINWPAPGKEILPPAPAGGSGAFPLSAGSAAEASHHKGKDPAALLRRFVPSDRKAVKYILKNSEAFVEWAARRRYDALILPLAAGRRLKQLRPYAAEYGIAVEAGGRSLSSLVPRKYFLIHRDFFRMEEGRRKMTHHFCPTNPGVIRLIAREGKKLFQAAAEVQVFHLWPDKGAETIWCSCPSCRAFTPPEQNRIAVNTAADILAELNPAACISFFEKPGEGGNIPLRKNLFRMEEIPEEEDFE